MNDQQREALSGFFTPGVSTEDAIAQVKQAAEKQTPKTIRQWSKNMLTNYVENLAGEKSWEKVGAASPEHVVDIIFSQIQVTLLGYATNVQEMKTKEEAIDRLLIIKND